MILNTNANPIVQREQSVTQSFQATLFIFETVSHYTLAPSYVSSDANSRES